MNIYDIVVTLLVFQLPIFWSNENALRNINDIVVTLLVSQPPIFWSNVDALRGEENKRNVSNSQKSKAVSRDPGIQAGGCE